MTVQNADRRGVQMTAPSERAPRGKYDGGVLEQQQKRERKNRPGSRIKDG